MPLEIVVGEIIKQNTDIIVSYNNNLKIFNDVLKNKIEKELEQFKDFKKQQLIVTSGFDLSKYIIHVEVPIYNGNSDDYEIVLTETYNNILNKTLMLKADSISIPLLKTKNAKYNKQSAIDIALKTIGSFLEKEDLNIKLILLEEDKSKEIKYPELHKLINKKDFKKRLFAPSSRKLAMGTRESFESVAYEKSCPADFDLQEIQLEDVLDKMDISFSQSVLNLIDEKGYKDADVYKRANLDRRLFSKLRSNDDYQPSKNTAIALAFALKLSVPQTEDLLLKAGYSLSKSNYADIIVKYCLDNEIYDIYRVNELLFFYNQKQLGSI